MVIPHISWKKMSVEELKQHYETTTQEYSQEDKEMIITLVRMVEEGKLRAFKDPTGEIRYQNNPLYVLEVRK
ncbi:MAG: hypothetical protein HWN68_19580 [Desulfobacterales bacterium]|nr:hypothetical protein [Desulfobacterales bacterium]